MRIIIKPLGKLFVITTITVALLLSVARLLLPLLGDYRHEIAARLGDALGQPLLIGEINAQWRGVRPSLQLKNVVLLDRQTHNKVLMFDEVAVQFNFLKSILNGRPELQTLTLSGVELAIKRHANGALAVAGMESGGSDLSASVKESLRQWLFSQRYVSIHNAVVHWSDDQKNTPDLTVTALQLSIANHADHHQLQGGGQLPHSLGRDFKFAMEVTGEFLQAQGWHGAIYLEGTELALAPWSQGLARPQWPRLAEGVMGIKVWSEWRHGAVVAVDADIDAQRLLMQAPPGTKLTNELSAVKINRIAGRTVWERSEQGWSLRLRQLQSAMNGHVGSPLDADMTLIQSD
ncbi:MAG: hypothetical protein FD130_1600, partial [Halothiobacillaceae bacterium]